MHEPDNLAPRERQVFDLLCQNGALTVSEVVEALPDKLSASAVRAMLSRLEAKKFVVRSHDERGNIYSAAIDTNSAANSALNRLVNVFFGGSPVRAANALLGNSENLSSKELEDLEKLISNARKNTQNEGRGK